MGGVEPQITQRVTQSSLGLSFCGLTRESLKGKLLKAWDYSIKRLSN